MEETLNTDSCAGLSKLEAALTTREKALLAEHGFLHKETVLISPLLTANCELRLNAGAYIQSKINNADKRIQTPFLLAHKCEIAELSIAALKSSIWDGGAKHDVWNVASEDLMPCWQVAAVKKMKSLNSVVIDLFTESMFKNPPRELLPLIRSELKNRKMELSDALLLVFLLHNMKEKVPPLSQDFYNSGDPIDSPAKAIKQAKLLLKRHNPISLTTARDFLETAFNPEH